MTLLAHMGHDAVSMAFFVPTIGFLVWLAVTQFRQRRAQRASGAERGSEG